METTEEATRPTADEVNAHLSDGGQVAISTYARVTIYKPKHAGMFFEEKRGETVNLAVKHGKGSHTLSIGPRMIVGIRFSVEA